MNRNILICIMALLLASCGDALKEKPVDTKNALAAAGELSTVATDSMCYLLAEGFTKKDTTLVQLAITGNSVAGTMIYIPYQKDSRRGTLSGIKKGKNISAQWIYMQEGILDSIAVSFRATEDVLTQQQSIFDTHTGKEYFPNNAEYNRYYKAVDCAVIQSLITKTGN